MPPERGRGRRSGEPTFTAPPLGVGVGWLPWSSPGGPYPRATPPPRQTEPAGLHWAALLRTQASTARSVPVSGAHSGDQQGTC